MAYGMEVTGADGSGTFLVTDTSQNLIHQGVAAAGTGTSVTISGVNEKPLIFVNAKGVSGQDDGIITIWNQATRTASFFSVKFTFPSNQTVTGTLTARSVNYFIVKNASDGTAQNQNYGIQALTSSGVVAFDSRQFGTNESHYISQISVAGLNNASYGDEITGDENAFIEMGTWSSAFPQNATSSLFIFRAAVFNSTNIIATSRIGINVFSQGSGGFFTSAWGLPSMLIGKLR